MCFCCAAGAGAADSSLDGAIMLMPVMLLNASSVGAALVMLRADVIAACNGDTFEGSLP